MADTTNGGDAEIKTEFIEDAILDTEEMKKLFVGGIAPEAKDDELKEFLEKACNGTVSDVAIIRKENKEKKTHFGFVIFDSSAHVDEILLKRKDLQFSGKNLVVHRAVPKNNNSPVAHEKTKKLFIANLPKEGCSGEDLKTYFEERHDPKFGTIESVILIKKKDEKGEKTEENKGFGFVTVSTEDMADKMAIQHASFDFNGRKIELKKSVDSGNKRGGRGGRGGRGQYAGGAQYAAGYGGGYGYGGYGAHWPSYGGYGEYYDYGNYGGGYGGGYPSSRGARGGRGGRFTPY